MASRFLTEPASIGRSPYLGSRLCIPVCIMERSVALNFSNLDLLVYLFTAACHSCCFRYRSMSHGFVVDMSYSRPEKTKPGPLFLLDTRVPRIGGRYSTNGLLMVCTRRVDLHARGLGWGSTISCSCVVTRRDEARVHVRQPVHTYHFRLSDPRLRLRCTRAQLSHV